MVKKFSLALTLCVGLFSEEVTNQVQLPAAGLLTSIDNEPSAIVGNCVNVISGEFFDREVDLKIPGPEPLLVERVLIHNNSHPQESSVEQERSEWYFNHEIDVSRYSIRKSGYGFTYRDHYGGYMGFFNENKGDPVAYLNDKILKQGVINTGRGVISAQTNMRNHLVHNNASAESCTLEMGDGSLLEFSPSSGLKEEILPNRLKVKYQRNKEKEVTERSLLNLSGKKLSSYSIQKLTKTQREYKACDGRTLRYHYGTPEGSEALYLKQVERSDAPSVTYEYHPKRLLRYYIDTNNPDRYDAVFFIEKPSLLRKNYPEKRFVELKYYQPKYHFYWDRETQKELAIPYLGRVKEVLAPLGVDAVPLSLYTFQYQLSQGEHQGGTTSVFDALQRKTDYQYNDRLRLTTIIKYDSAGKPYTIETMHWGAEDTEKEIELTARSFGLANKKEKSFVKTYTYDSLGNVKEEKLYGNLTGKGAPVLFENGQIKNKCECRFRRYTYSQDKFNLLLSSTEGEVTKRFTYLPDSNLLSSCLHETKQGVFLRHFYEYDENGMVTQHLVDDGKSKHPTNLEGVTERKIELIQRSTTYPVGLPMQVSEYYLNEQGKETLALRKVNTFDGLGRLLTQKTYDCNNNFSHQEEWTYDAHGNILTHTNPMGHLIVRSYDANDNMVSEQDHQLLKQFTYDYMNRLIRVDELHADGTLSKHFQYDLCGNPITAIDVFGNETRTEYDAFNRPSVVYGAPIHNAQDKLYSPKTSYVFDELSHPTQIIDSENNSTLLTYNLYGKPCHMRYPDGSEEHFEYDLEGRLIREIHKNGSWTIYQRDHQDRVLSTKHFSSSGELLTQTEAGYNTFHLLWEKDAVGTVTHYSYDRQGRKSAIRKEESLTLFTYDSLGRVAKTCSDGCAKSYQYDTLNRVIEENIENSEGDILTWTRFAYDTEGHKSLIEQEGAITEIIYDSHGIPIQTIDPEGHVTHSRLKLDYYNAKGQNLFCLETIDPLGQITVAIQDSQGRLIEKFKKNPFGKEIQNTQYSYNSRGGCTKTTHTVYNPDGQSRTVTHQVKYDAMNRPILLIQAAGTPDEKRTSSHYNKSGQKESVIKPDGVTLKYTYDQLGRLLDHTASDHSFHYSYTYDLHAEPIQIDDLVHNCATQRTYNSLGRVIEEQLANGLCTKMSYLPSGQLKKLTLPDQSAIQYDYNGPQLKKVERLKSDGSVSYQHTYDLYNNAGNLLSATLIYNLGSYSTEYTKKGQIKKINAPHYSEEITYDPVGNLIKRLQGGQEESYAYDGLYQLTMESGHSYSYDSLHNRLSKDSSCYTYNQLDQILADGNTTYVYDPNGNMIQAGERKFTYDALNRLTSMTIGDNRTSYTYDAMHRCFTRENHQKREHLLYVGQNDIGTTDEKQQLIHLRVLGKGLAAEMGAAIALELKSEVYVPLHDHNGNVMGLLNQAGELVESYRYTAFGEETISQASINPWRFASKRQEGDYILFGRRFYDPALGRWLSPDPLGYEAGPNLYAYVGNNPLTHFDPYGLQEESRNLLERTRDFLRDSWNSFREGVSSALSKTRDAISRLGSAIKDFSHHAVPIPIVKDIGGLAGHFLENGTFKGYTSSLQHEHSQIYHMESKPHMRDDLRILYINGINTSLAEAIRQAEFISQLFGDVRVDLLYNGSCGTAADVGEVALQKCGIPTHSVNVTIKGLREMIHEVGSNGLVVAIAHSQGGQILHEALKQLPAENRAQVVATTLGSARIIGNEGTRMSVNYISTRDPIPFLSDPLHFTQAKFGNVPEVRFVPSMGPKLFDHFVSGDTYQRALADFRDLFYKNLW